MKFGMLVMVFLLLGLLRLYLPTSVRQEEVKPSGQLPVQEQFTGGALGRGMLRGSIIEQKLREPVLQGMSVEDGWHGEHRICLMLFPCIK